MEARSPFDTLPDLLEIDRLQAEILNDERQKRESSGAIRVPSAPALRPVLIVEDDDDVRACVSRILEDEGVPTLTARNGEQGLALVREHGPAVVLLDLMMPGMDGWEFRRRVQAETSGPAPKLVIMSALSPDPSLGAAFWLRKPLGLDDLLSVAKLATS